jgi:hypothetical protein
MSVLDTRGMETFQPRPLGEASVSGGRTDLGGHRAIGTQNAVERAKGAVWGLMNARRHESRKGGFEGHMSGQRQATSGGGPGRAAVIPRTFGARSAREARQSDVSVRVRGEQAGPQLLAARRDAVRVAVRCHTPTHARTPSADAGRRAKGPCAQLEPTDNERCSLDCERTRRRTVWLSRARRRLQARSPSTTGFVLSRAMTTILARAHTWAASHGHVFFLRKPSNAASRLLPRRAHPSAHVRAPSRADSHRLLSPRASASAQLAHSAKARGFSRSHLCTPDPFCQVPQDGQACTHRRGSSGLGRGQKPRRAAGAHQGRGKEHLAALPAVSFPVVGMPLARTYIRGFG